jgi:hypothetical protein
VKGKDMDLGEYFENTEGLGVLATADAKGNVDAAIYSRPHVMEDGTVAFIMANHLSYRNVTDNPKAAYLFIEKGPGYKGKRLYLTKTDEQSDQQVVDSMRRKQRAYQEDKRDSCVVYFKVEKVRALVGDDLE